MRKTLTLWFVMLAVLVAGAVVARADTVTQGDPFLSHSWSQAFYSWTSPGVSNSPWTSLDFYITGNTFANPGVSAISGGWTGFYSSTHAHIGGAAVAPNVNIFYTLTFAGNPGSPSPFSVYFLQYDGDKLLLDESSVGTWNGGWSWAALPQGYTPPVPEPTSLLLFGSGLVGAAGAIRRKLQG